MSIHLRLGDHQEEKLKSFAEARKSNMTAVIRYALDKLYEEEDVDPTREDMLKKILDPLFAIPRGFKLRSFYLTIYLLAGKYPKESSKSFWGPGVYLSSFDMSHKEVLVHIIAKQREYISGKREQS